MPLDYNKVMSIDPLWRVKLTNGDTLEGKELPWRQIADYINSKILIDKPKIEPSDYNKISSYIDQFFLIPWNIGLVLDKNKRLIFVARTTIIKEIETGKEIRTIKFLFGYQQTKNNTNFKSVIEVDDFLLMKDTDNRND